MMSDVCSHGAKPETDPQPDTPNSNDILIRLGEEPGPWYCSGRIVYLRLAFDNNDRYQNATLKPELHDCL